MECAAPFAGVKERDCEKRDEQRAQRAGNQPKVSADAAGDALDVAPAESAARAGPRKARPNLNAGHDDLVDAAAANNADKAVSDDFVPCGSKDDVTRDQENQDKDAGNSHPFIR